MSIRFDTRPGAVALDVLTRVARGATELPSCAELAMRHGCVVASAYTAFRDLQLLGVVKTRHGCKPLVTPDGQERAADLLRKRIDGLRSKADGIEAAMQPDTATEPES